MALTQIIGSGISGVTVGNFITMADQWRLTGSTNEGSNADVTSNWERNDSSGWGGVGIGAFGLTESSGVFSFATTGVYLIHFTADFFMTNNDQSASFTLNVTINNSDFTLVSQAHSGSSGGGATTNQGGSNTFLFDVSNTTTHKFKFATASMGSSTKLNGSSTSQRTGFTVVRLAAT